MADFFVFAVNTPTGDGCSILAGVGTPSPVGLKLRLAKGHDRCKQQLPSDSWRTKEFAANIRRFFQEEYASRSVQEGGASRIDVEPYMRFIGRQTLARDTFNASMKRTLDLLIAIPLLVAVSPILLVAMVLLLIIQKRPIFFVSSRYVSLGKAIPVIKFRTMVKDAASPRFRLYERFMRAGYLDIPIDCEVYTPLGRIFERLQIVELPQLINVIFHRMSLVGNRPLPEENLDLLRQFPSWEGRMSSPGGITGISQIVGKLNLKPVERLRLECLYSDVYLKGNILKCDAMIIWNTVSRVLLRGEGISMSQAEKLMNACLPSPEKEQHCVEQKLENGATDSQAKRTRQTSEV